MDDLLTSYREAIESLFARTTAGIKPGLSRTEAFLDRLGAPHRSLPAIHVAGTNGKGSVVASCEALIRARGLKVGRYTSPHLIDFRERITVNGKPISEIEVLEFLERWIAAAEELGATFFEITTALAFTWLASQEVDIAVIETGLGGRLDSTNVLTPRVATVTSIGLDHTELLGDTLEAIAREKAGIFKKGVPAVIGESTPALRDLLAACATEAGSSAVSVIDAEYAISEVEVAGNATSFAVNSSWLNERVATPLPGAHQARNTVIAIETVRAAGEDLLPPPARITEALSTVFLPGRFQRYGKLIFDVAHNPDGARTVAQTLAALAPPRPRVALLAVLSDKDWRGIVRELSLAVDSFIFTNAPSAPPDRRWNPADAQAFAESEGIHADLETDLETAIVLGEQVAGTLLVTGSFHTVGDVMSRLQVSPFAA